ncbi:MAG: GNAT family N-acetyltransferase [Thermoplasmatota archaeon]
MIAILDPTPHEKTPPAKRDEIAIRVANAEEITSESEALSRILIEAVAHGAGLGYGEPPSKAAATRAWAQWAAEVQAGRRICLVARIGPQVVGTVQLDLAQVPNAGHRAELAKLIVKFDARGRGIGLALIRAALEEGRRRGLRTVWLCTIDQAAERLYARAGFSRSGEIPQWSQVPFGTWRTASFWWIHL